MDPLMIAGGGVVLCIIIVFFLFKINSKDEDSFRKAVANNQLLAEELFKDKKDKKQQKKKDDKKKNKNEEKKAEQEKKAPEPAAPKAEETKREQPAKEVKKAPEPAKKEESKKPQNQPAKKEEKKRESEPPVVKKEETQPVQAANGDETKKPNKKKNKKRVDEEDDGFEEFVEAKNKKAKKMEKRDVAPPSAQSNAHNGGASTQHQSQANHTRTSSATSAAAPKPTSLNELDVDKVLTRFSSIEEVEPEYISFLVTHVQNTASQIAKAKSEAASARNHSTDIEKTLGQTKSTVAKLENELASTKRTMAELASKSAQSSSSEQSLRIAFNAKNEELEKLRRETDQLRKSLAERVAAPSPVSAPASVVIPSNNEDKEEAERLRAESKAQATRISELEEKVRVAQKERKQLEQTVLQQKTQEDAVVSRDVLLAESRQNAKALSERLTQIEDTKRALEQRAVDAERSVGSMKEELEKREATHAADTQSLKSMIEELNKEVVRFEQARAEQRAMVEKLAVKERELGEKSRALEAAERELEALKQAESKQLNGVAEKHQAEVAELNYRIAELEKAAKEIVIPANKPSEVEEVVELKRSNYLNAAPSETGGEVSALKEEIAKLNKKNDELRERNHAMVEQVNELEKKVFNGGGASEKKDKAKKEDEGKKDKGEEERLATERRLVASHIGKLVPAAPALDEKADAKAYEAWLKTVSSSLKSAQEKAKQATSSNANSNKKKAPTTSNASSSTVVSEEVEQLKAENEEYRHALADLESELVTIAELASQKEEGYIRRIADLEKKSSRVPVTEVEPSSPRVAAPSTVPLLDTVPSPPVEAVEPTVSPATVVGDSSPPTLTKTQKRKNKKNARLAEELRACHEIRTQIAEVRAALSSVDTVAGNSSATPAQKPAAVPAPVSSGNSTHSEDDGSWEVVA